MPPFEVAKAHAFDVVISQMEKHLGKSSRQLLGEDKGFFIAKQLELKGGGVPGRTAVFAAIRKCKQKSWYPGLVSSHRRGRPPAFSPRQKKAMARVAMDTKRKLVRPTPQRVRAKLPRMCVNPETQAPASNWTIYKVFHTMCYDETEDDPWVYMHSPSKDYLSEDMKRARVAFAEHVLEHFPASSWWSHVAIDPCISVLASTNAQSEDQRVAAMGNMKMMSPKSRYKGPNLRAPSTAKTQGREEDKVHWTPIFARGKVHIYICDRGAARRDPRLPARLNNGGDIAKFVQNVLPGVLRQMQQRYSWERTPRTIVHDKASYFVAPRAQRLARPIADAFQQVGMKSWLGDADADCSWLAGRLGDVFLHETVISHIRRGLDHNFPCAAPGETLAQFTRRMARVQDHINSGGFEARGGGGLTALAKSLRKRCAEVSRIQGDRLRT